MTSKQRAEVEPVLRWGLLAVTSGLFVFLRGQELWGASAGLRQWVPVALAVLTSVGSLVRLWQLWIQRGEGATEGR